MRQRRDQRWFFCFVVAAWLLADSARCRSLRKRKTQVTQSPSSISNATSSLPTLPFTISPSTKIVQYGSFPMYLGVVLAAMVGFSCLIVLLLKRRADLRARGLNGNSDTSNGQQRYDLADSFLERGEQEWQCAVCLHQNHPNKQDCVMCGTPRVVTAQLVSDELDPRKGSNKLTSFVHPVISNEQLDINMARLRPRIIKRADGLALTLRQRAARKRFQWKRQRTDNGWTWVQMHLSGCSPKSEATKMQGDSTRSVISIGAHPSFKREGSAQAIFQREDSTKKLPLLEADYAPETSWLRRCTSETTSKSALEQGLTLSKTESGKYILTDVLHVKMDDAIDPDDTLNFDLDKLEEISQQPFKAKTRWLFQHNDGLLKVWTENFLEITIERGLMLSDSILLLEVPPHFWRQPLRVKFRDEPGFDAGGLLREWYSLLCEELFAQDLGLFSLSKSETTGYWINPESEYKMDDYAKYYRFVGRVIGKALLENQLLSICFAIPLLKYILGMPVTVSDLEYVDTEVYKNCIWLRSASQVENLCLDFTVQKRGEGGKLEVIELKPGGVEIEVNDSNKEEYISLLAKYWLFDNVGTQISALVQGVRETIPWALLFPFDYQELDLLIYGVHEIDVQDWRAHTDIVYTVPNTPTALELLNVTWFWDEICGLSPSDHEKLLQIVTGSSRVPLEGFKALTGQNGKVMRFSIHFIDLPSGPYVRAHTCFNRLDMPVYESRDVLSKHLTILLHMERTGFTMQ